MRFREFITEKWPSLSPLISLSENVGDKSFFTSIQEFINSLDSQLLDDEVKWQLFCSWMNFRIDRDEMTYDDSVTKTAAKKWFDASGDPKDKYSNKVGLYCDSKFRHSIFSTLVIFYSQTSFEMAEGSPKKKEFLELCLTAALLSEANDEPIGSLYVAHCLRSLYGMSADVDVSLNKLKGYGRKNGAKYQYIQGVLFFESVNVSTEDLGIPEPKIDRSEHACNCFSASSGKGYPPATDMVAKMQFVAQHLAATVAVKPKFDVAEKAINSIRKGYPFAAATVLKIVTVEPGTYSHFKVTKGLEEYIFKRRHLLEACNPVAAADLIELLDKFKKNRAEVVEKRQTRSRRGSSQNIDIVAARKFIKRNRRGFRFDIHLLLSENLAMLQLVAASGDAKRAQWLESLQKLRTDAIQFFNTTLPKIKVGSDADVVTEQVVMQSLYMLIFEMEALHLDIAKSQVLLREFSEIKFRQFNKVVVDRPEVSKAVRWSQKYSQELAAVFHLGRLSKKPMQKIVDRKQNIGKDALASGDVKLAAAIDMVYVEIDSVRGVLGLVKHFAEIKPSDNEVDKKILEGRLGTIKDAMSSLTTTEHRLQQMSLGQELRQRELGKTSEHMDNIKAIERALTDINRLRQNVVEAEKKLGLNVSKLGADRIEDIVDYSRELLVRVHEAQKESVHADPVITRLYGLEQNIGPRFVGFVRRVKMSFETLIACCDEDDKSQVWCLRAQSLIKFLEVIVNQGQISALDGKIYFEQIRTCSEMILETLPQKFADEFDDLKFQLGGNFDNFRKPVFLQKNEPVLKVVIDELRIGVASIQGNLESIEDLKKWVRYNSDLTRNVNFSSIKKKSGYTTVVLPKLEAEISKRANRTLRQFNAAVSGMMDVINTRNVSVTALLKANETLKTAMKVYLSLSGGYAGWDQKRKLGELNAVMEKLQALPKIESADTESNDAAINSTKTQLELVLEKVALNKKIPNSFRQYIHTLINGLNNKPSYNDLLVICDMLKLLLSLIIRANIEDRIAIQPLLKIMTEEVPKLKATIEFELLPQDAEKREDFGKVLDDIYEVVDIIGKEAGCFGELLASAIREAITINAIKIALIDESEDVVFLYVKLLEAIDNEVAGWDANDRKTHAESLTLIRDKLINKIQENIATEHAALRENLVQKIEGFDTLMTDQLGAGTQAATALTTAMRSYDDKHIAKNLLVREENDIANFCLGLLKALRHEVEQWEPEQQFQNAESLCKIQQSIIDVFIETANDESIIKSEAKPFVPSNYAELVAKQQNLPKRSASDSVSAPTDVASPSQSKAGGGRGGILRKVFSARSLLPHVRSAPPGSHPTKAKSGSARIPGPSADGSGSVSPRGEDARRLMMIKAASAPAPSSADAASRGPLSTSAVHAKLVAAELEPDVSSSRAVNERGRLRVAPAVPGARKRSGGSQPVKDSRGNQGSRRGGSVRVMSSMAASGKASSSTAASRASSAPLSLPKDSPILGPDSKYIRSDSAGVAGSKGRRGSARGVRSIPPSPLVAELKKLFDKQSEPSSGNGARNAAKGTRPGNKS